MRRLRLRGELWTGWATALRPYVGRHSGIKVGERNHFKKEKGHEDTRKRTDGRNLTQSDPRGRNRTQNKSPSHVQTPNHGNLSNRERFEHASVPINHSVSHSFKSMQKYEGKSTKGKRYDRGQYSYGASSLAEPRSMHASLIIGVPNKSLYYCIVPTTWIYTTFGRSGYNQEPSLIRLVRCPHGNQMHP